MKRPPPKIVFVANLWTLLGHPSASREWSLSRKMRAVADAGFDGVTTRAQPGLQRLLKEHGLRFTGFFSSNNRREFRSHIEVLKKSGAENINVQLGDDFTLPREATGLAVDLLREARRQGIYVAIEVHRDTATETPEKLDAIAEGYRRATGEFLPLTWDHSHLAVVKHVTPARFSEVLLRRRQLIQAARLFHCRPFNGQHAQVPVFDARRRLTPEFKAWLLFARDLFRCWLAGSRPGNELWVCPEIGPCAGHGYNLSTMPPSWDQAIVARDELEKVWRALV